MFNERLPSPIARFLRPPRLWQLSNRKAMQPQYHIRDPSASTSKTQKRSRERVDRPSGASTHPIRKRGPASPKGVMSKTANARPESSRTPLRSSQDGSAALRHSQRQHLPSAKLLSAVETERRVSTASTDPLSYSDQTIVNRVISTLGRSL